MGAYAALAVAFVVGFVLRTLGWPWWSAFCASCFVVPVFIVAVFLMRLDGWEWWTIAVIFGSLYGAASGALGVLAAAMVGKVRNPKNPSPGSGHAA